MSSKHSGYEGFQVKQRRLGDLLQQSQPIFRTLNMQGWLDTIQQLSKRVNSDCFKVLVLGEFKRGKSTFINAPG